MPRRRKPKPGDRGIMMCEQTGKFYIWTAGALFEHPDGHKECGLQLGRTGYTSLVEAMAKLRSLEAV